MGEVRGAPGRAAGSGTCPAPEESASGPSLHRKNSRQKGRAHVEEVKPSAVDVDEDFGRLQTRRRRFGHVLRNDMLGRVRVVVDNESLHGKINCCPTRGILRARGTVLRAQNVTVRDVGGE
jgi:hypothetical protein